jgi:hypothetical protein
MMYPVKLLLQERGDMTFDALIARMKCGKCGNKPAPVYLGASHHRTCGPSVLWSAAGSPSSIPSFEARRPALP